ncbi:MAG: Smr/MutS family protein [Desulfovibrio sp.]|jgi:DNA mismatch repair protein MutS2|nr:Smr/MutS family protein [Desulfovibrio sp.]
MDTRALHALELGKVLAYLAGFALSEPGRRACLALRPLRAPDPVVLLAGLRGAAQVFEQGRLSLLRGTVRLVPFADMEPFLNFAASPRAMPDIDDLFALRELLAQGKELIAALREDPAAGENWPLWLERCAAISWPARCSSALSRCLGDDGQIRDEASPELSLVRGDLRSLHRQCIKKVKEYAAEYNILHFLQDSFMTLSSDRYVLPLKSDFKGRLQGIIHDYSQTGETCYFEPLFLVEINNRLQNLKREEREEERKILDYLGGLVREDLPGIRALYEFLVEVDLLQARAALAECYGGRMAEFAPDRGLYLRQARHPLLALAASPAARKALRISEQRGEQRSGQDGEEEFPPEAPDQTVFPTDIELPPDRRALIISGGNAGGKTVCLKSVGLIALMGLCSLPVPVAAGSVMPPWDDIHSFIGDEQSLEDHVSTFTAQITHLSRIWPALSGRSLVLLDEFGAGTDPAQGAALAQALVDALLESGAALVAATHFPALKAYALTTDGVRAASMLFDPKSKKPLFRIAYDQVGASRALDVAREHGLPEAILRRAEQYLLLGGEDSTALVDRLNALEVTRSGEIEALRQERTAYADKERRLREDFAAERAGFFDSLRAEAQTVLKDWKAMRVSHKQTLKELSRLRAAVKATPGEAENAGPKPRITDLSVRQKVRYLPLKRAGVIQALDERKQRVQLDLGGISLWTDVAELELLDAGAEKNSPGPAGVGFSAAPAPLRLDLRGERVDVALSALERFLDRALLNGREGIEVIHGRGTGVLRREAHSFLRSSPHVRAFKLAPEDQGGDGMTIVELK